MKKAVILLSGGLDSTTCLAVAKAQGFACYGLSFSYGQKHATELVAAQKIAQHMEVADHKIVTLDTTLFAGSALTDHDLHVPDFDENKAIPITYVPARNTIFLAMSLA
ncbi:MAG: 7-cyano-7-deazaguanine synthase, partial [bacterium]|nr:7-cyano-7-deazaguanine synthase [bacterium]